VPDPLLDPLVSGASPSRHASTKRSPSPLMGVLSAARGQTWPGSMGEFR
jgi:hypothetical protein